MEQNILAPKNQIKELCMLYNQYGFNRTEIGWYPTLFFLHLPLDRAAQEGKNVVFQAIRLLCLSSVYISCWSLHYASH